MNDLPSRPAVRSVALRQVVIVVLVAVLAGGAGGFALARATAATCPLNAAACAALADFWESWRLAERHFVDPTALDPARMTEGAISGMLASLGDSGHTAYLSPAAAALDREQTSGRFEGIGAYVDVRDEQPLIIEPLDGSPAERAGLRAGDRILTIDGVTVRGITIDALRTRLRGPAGSDVVLTVSRDTEALPRTITVTRGEIRLDSVTWAMLPDMVAHVRITRFAEQTGAEVRAALVAARAAGARALIIDVRNNPGGLVSQLVAVAGEFVPAGTTVMIEQDRDGASRPYRATGAGEARDLPLAILINRNSASAAEILAAALRDAGRATLVGEATFGTATVLQPFTLASGAQLRLAIAQWLTPGGAVVRSRGVAPDVQVVLAAGATPLSPARAAQLGATVWQGDDGQLVAALRVLTARP
jgi:carboxyl-terminal processing protease